MQRQFDFNKEIFIPGGADFLETIFVDYLNPPSRAAFALTSQCHAAFFQAVIERAVRSDLHSELTSVGFKFDAKLDLGDIELGRQCLSILKNNHTFSGERKQFVALLASDRLQSLMSISSWQVAIFCLLQIMGLELDKPEIGHAFVTDANLAVFKKLAVKLNQTSADATRGEIVDQLLPAFNDCCQALTLAGEVTLSHALNVYKYEVYLPSEVIEGTTVSYRDQLLINFVTDIQASTHQFTDNDLVRRTPQELYGKLKVLFGFHFIRILSRCYSDDKRSARWIIGLLNNISEEDLGNLKRFVSTDTSDRLICNARMIHGCFPAITPDLFEREYNFDCPTATLLPHHKQECIELARGAKSALTVYLSKGISNSAQLTRVVRLFETKAFIRALVLASRIGYSERPHDSYRYSSYGVCAAELINLFSHWRFSDLINVERSTLDTMAKTADVMSRIVDLRVARFPQLHEQLRRYAFRPQSLVWKLSSARRNAMMDDRLRLTDDRSNIFLQEPQGWWFDSALFYHLSVDKITIQKGKKLGTPAIILSRCAAYVVDDKTVSYLNILLKLPDALYEKVLTLLNSEFENYRTLADERSTQGCVRYLVQKLHNIDIFNLFYNLFKERKINANLSRYPNFVILLFEDCSLDDIIKLDSIRLTNYRSWVDSRSGPASLLSVIMDVFSLVSSEPAANPDTITIYEALELGELIVAHAHNQSLIAFINSHQNYFSLVRNRANLIEMVAPKPNQNQAGPKRAAPDTADSDEPKPKKFRSA